MLKGIKGTDIGIARSTSHGTNIIRNHETLASAWLKCVRRPLLTMAEQLELF
jgi:hypothetical protein